jgi:predicted DNA binding CopG/RHH family protein
MPEDGTSTPAPTAAPGTHEPTFDGPFDEERAKRTIGTLREAEIKLKGQVTELSAKAQKYDEWENAQKTELQKLTDQLEAERAQRIAFEGQALRARVALAKDLPAELVDRLQGETEEELLADADKLLALVVPRTGPPRASSAQGAPEPNGRSGGSMNDKLRRAAGY